jgi:hypothetical protein
VKAFASRNEGDLVSVILIPGTVDYKVGVCETIDHIVCLLEIDDETILQAGPNAMLAIPIFTISSGIVCRRNRIRGRTHLTLFPAVQRTCCCDEMARLKSSGLARYVPPAVLRSTLPGRLTDAVHPAQVGQSAWLGTPKSRPEIRPVPDAHRAPSFPASGHRNQAQPSLPRQARPAFRLARCSSTTSLGPASGRRSRG